jgi:hypothetical protein
MISSTTTRKPLGDLTNDRPSKKPRTISNPTVNHPHQKGVNQQPGSKQVSFAASVEEIPIAKWLTLPPSEFGIYYELGSTKLYKHPPTGMSMLQMAANKCPFELKMQELKDIFSSKYPKGAGLIYVREIFERHDPDYGGNGTTVDVTTITQEQMNRLRLVIAPVDLREAMVKVLSFYHQSPFFAASIVLDHFLSFKKTYGKLRDHREKFNQLFGFTFALHKFDEWLYRMERGFGRSKMVDGLATRWKNLFKHRTPEELDLDLACSYPAVLFLLQSFKVKVERAPTFGDPPMLFKYE